MRPSIARQVRPWAAASLAGMLSLLLICLAEVVSPPALVQLFGYALRDIRPSGHALRAAHIRIGAPLLAFVITSIVFNSKDDDCTESIRDFAAHFVLSKSFGVLFLVPPAILFCAIQAKAGWNGWSGIFAGGEFHAFAFLKDMRVIRFLPLQSFGFGIASYVIRPNRSSLFAAGIGAAAFLFLSLVATTIGIHGRQLIWLFPSIPIL